MVDVIETLKPLEQSMIDFRRDLHRFPELSFEEFETTDKIAAELDAIGLPYTRTEPTGLWADIIGTATPKPGDRSDRTILLRADMDALPVQELNDDLEFKSSREGKMHACGHDNHVAMLLAATKALWQVRDQFAGRIRVIFQPAEETALGARKMLDQGVADGVDEVFGIHIWGGTRTGQISCSPGAFFAAADFFDIDFHGKGAHASQPHAGVDAVMMAAQFVTNVQAVVSRMVDPFQPAVVTIGVINAGQRMNVLAEDAHLAGTCRTFDAGVRQLVEQKLGEFAQTTASNFGGSAKVDYQRGTQILINDETSANRVRRITSELFGEQMFVDVDRVTGGEDFAEFMVGRPGAFALLGCANPDKGIPFTSNHSGAFAVDEDALISGAALYMRYALDYLSGR